MAEVTSLKHMKTLLIISSIWRLPLTNNVVLKTTYNVYSVIYQMALLAFDISLLINIPVSLLSKNFKLLNNAILYAVSVTLIMARNVIYQTRQVQDLIVQVESEIMREKNGCLWGMVQKDSRVLNRKYAFIIAVSTCTMLPTIFYGVITCLEHQNVNSTDNKPPMMPLWYPFDENVYYWTSFVLGFLIIMIGSLCNWATQILYLTLTTHVTFQLKSLQMFAEDLDLCYKVNLAHGKREEEEADDKILNSLKWLCCKHNAVIKFVKEINASIRNILLMDFSLYSINISATIIGMFMVETSFFMHVGLGFFCLLQVSQMFLMAWHGNEIRVQSVALSDALYQSQWYQYPTNCKKIVYLMMMRSKIPLGLDVGSIFPLTNETAVATIKAAYSCVAMIFSLANTK